MTEDQLEELRDQYVGRPVQRCDDGRVGKGMDVTVRGVKVETPAKRRETWPLAVTTVVPG